MSLYVGVAKEIITPQVGGYLFGYNNHTKSDSINDDLTVTALFIKSDETSAIIISVSVCLIHEDLIKEIRDKVESATGVAAEHVVVSCTHTHSGPRTTYFPQFKNFGDLDREYCNNILIPKCIAASKTAASKITTATVGVSVTESLVGINRRQLLEDDTVILGQNPWDPYDPAMTVITFKSIETNEPVANIVHVGAHCTAAGTNHEVTRDWAGVMVDRLEEESGAITLFLNGTLGDIAPRMANGGSTGNLKHAMELGGLAGIDAVRAYKSIRAFYNEPLQIICGDLTIPYKPRIPHDDVQRYLESNEINERGFMKSSLQCLDSMYRKNDPGPDEWNARQVIIRIGPVVLVPFPFEVSTEIGLRLRAYSPYAHTLLLSCTNGSNSYLPAQSQICRGGYEIESFLWFRPRQLPDDTDTRLIKQNIDLIGQLESSQIPKERNKQK